MSDKPNNMVNIVMGSSSVEQVDRDTDVCVVYLGTVGESETVHTAPFGTDSLGLDPIIFEPGGSLVNAGLLADHLAKPHPSFKAACDRGWFTVYRDAADALKARPAELTAMIKVTRHAAVLRAWLRVEEAREPKRKMLLEGLRERLRINADHSTPKVTLAQLATLPKDEPRRRKAS